MFYQNYQYSRSYRENRKLLNPGEGVTARIAQLEHDNGDLRARREHLEKELESRLTFQEQQDKEVDNERNQLCEKIKMLESALQKLRNENRVSINNLIMAQSESAQNMVTLIDVGGVRYTLNFKLSMIS